MNKTNPSILITGANGFIGSFLVKEGLKRGYDVWAGVRKGSDCSLLTDSRIRLIDLPYSNPEELEKTISKVMEEGTRWDYVIHNAGLTKTTDKKNFYTVNSTYTRNLLHGLEKTGCIPHKFLLMSSLSSFGKGDEKDFRPIRLTDTQKPDTVYGKSKLGAENHVRKQTAFPWVIMRPTGVYGPGEKDYFMEIKSIRSGIDMAVGSIPQKITFIYVKDLARCVFMALENENIRNKEYFVADGDVYTDEEFARLIQQILGKKHVFRARIPLPLVKIACMFSEQIGKLTGKSMTLNSDKYIILKQRNWICETQPLQDDLGFYREYNLRKGLEESIQWYQENGWL